MSLATKIKKVQIENEEFLLTIDMRTIQYYKEYTGNSFLKAITSMSELNEDVLFPLIGGMIRKVDEPAQPLGVEFLYNYDPIAMLNFMTPYLEELLSASMPKQDVKARKTKKK